MPDDPRPALVRRKASIIGAGCDYYFADEVDAALAVLREQLDQETTEHEALKTAILGDPPLLARSLLESKHWQSLAATQRAESDQFCEANERANKAEAALASLRAQLRTLPHYAIEQQGNLYGPVDPVAGTFVLAQDVAALLASEGDTK